MNFVCGTTILVLCAFLNVESQQNIGGPGRIVYPAPRLVFLNPSGGGKPTPSTAMGSLQSPQVVNPNLPMSSQQQHLPSIRVIRPGQSGSSGNSAPRVRVIRPGSKVSNGNNNNVNYPQSRPGPQIVRPRNQPQPQPRPQPSNVSVSPEKLPPTPNQVVVHPPPARGTRIQRTGQPDVSESNDRRPSPVVIRPMPKPSSPVIGGHETTVRQSRPVVVRPVDVQQRQQDENDARDRSDNGPNRPLVAVINPSTAREQSNMIIDNNQGGDSIFINTDQLGFQGKQRNMKRGNNNPAPYWGYGRSSAGYGSRELEMRAYPENYCDSRKYSDEQLAAYNMQRVEHYVANLSCSTYFFECAIGSTFLKNCTSQQQAFDVNLMNCNYKYNIRPCAEYDHIMHCTVREECTSEEFACCNSPQKCIPYAKRCDGVPHCSDGEDETNCPSCAPDEFPCTKSDRCIPYSKRCDGNVDDCMDESNLDEYNCGQCSPNQFQCNRSDGNYGTPCIDLDQRCNGVTDCPSGEDELNCKSKGPKYLLCENQKQSVTKAQWCDNVEDCLDGSDELYCFYKK